VVPPCEELPPPRPPLRGRRPSSVVEAWRGVAARGGGGGVGPPVDEVRGGLPPGRRLGTGGGAVGGRGQRVSLVRHGDLLEEKLIPHRMEGGEGHGPLDESL
jgi:hypothetical protein